jgi:hypothetical protein
MSNNLWNRIVQDARGAAARERSLKIAMFRAPLKAVAEGADNRQGKGARRAVSAA